MIGDTDPLGSPADGRAGRYAHRRRALLEGATDYVLEQGARGLSLRPVAEALGVSHVSLLRHFNSKDDLLLAVLDNIRRRVAAQLDAAVAAVADDPSVADVVRAAWRTLSQPREQRQFLLLFELVYEPPGSANPEFARALVGNWVDLISGMLVGTGMDADQAQAQATLLLAQVRGLQLDLLVSGEVERVDRALEMALAGL